MEMDVIGMSEDTAEDVVKEFWRIMTTNEFGTVSAVLAPGFILDWPQTNERIRGAEAFARMNEEYPAHGPWQFTVNRVVAGETEVVTDVTITDGTQSARAISFFTVQNGKIAHILEFWPEPYAAPANRAHLVEPMR